MRLDRFDVCAAVGIHGRLVLKESRWSLWSTWVGPLSAQASGRQGSLPRMCDVDSHGS